jgi:hypothetical protein
MRYEARKETSFRKSQEESRSIQSFFIVYRCMTGKDQPPQETNFRLEDTRRHGLQKQVARQFENNV